MKICITGWYFEEEFLRQLHQIQHKYSVYLVCHREPPFYLDLPYQVIPNIGLEFGIYNFYLETLWDGESDILFAHDDTVITGGDCHYVFDRIASIPHDCAYIFRDWAEEKANGGKHGRAIFCSVKFLKKLKEDGNFWYDKENLGYIGNGQPRPYREDGSPIDFNVGISTFHRYLGRVRDAKIGLDVVNRVVFSEFEAGRRGTWRHKEREIARYGNKGKLNNSSP